VFLLINPGAVFQYGAFIDDVRFESRHYRTSHSAYFGTVHGGKIHDLTDGFFTYLGRLLDYLVFSLPSPYGLVSLVLVVVAGIGLFALWRRDRVLTACLALTFGATIVYFSTLHVFIVRNFLIFLPFFALLVGCGTALLLEVVKPRAVVLAAVGVVALLLGANALYLLSAARTISDEDRGSPTRLVSNYIEDHPDDDFALSPDVRRAFRREDRAIPSNARGAGTAGPDDYVFWYSQVEAISQTLTVWPTTKRGYYRDFGSREVNFDYYPTWPGRDRVLVMNRDELRAVGLTLRELGF
jgi:hypothetical protein